MTKKAATRLALSPAKELALRRVRACGVCSEWFVAHHLNQRHCSKVCSDTKEREWKRLWWEKNGSKYRRAG